MQKHIYMFVYMYVYIYIHVCTNFLSLCPPKFAAWLSPFIVIVVNSIIQPALISCVSVAIGFIRKSSEHTYVLQGNFIFLILNTIIIPLLSLSPLSSLIKVQKRNMFSFFYFEACCQLLLLCSLIAVCSYPLYFA